MKKLIIAILLISSYATASEKANTQNIANKLATGMWGWYNCTSNFRIFRYSPNKKFLITTTEKHTYPYYIIGPHTRGLEVLISGDRRRDSGGNPVRWFIVMNGDDQFFWLRTDRKDDDFRGPLTRCNPKVVQQVLKRSKAMREAWSK